LNWNALLDLFGGQEAMQARILRLEETQLEGKRELLDLAHRYLDGWRPKDFEEE